MNIESTKLENLFEKYFSKTASPDERIELAGLINEAQNKEEIIRLFSNAWEKYQGDGMIISAEKTEEILEHILGKRKAAAVHEMNTRNFKWWRWIAAAVVISIIATGIFLIANRNSNMQIAKKEIKTDVAPGKQGAILTLSDGRQIVLDTANNGKLAEEGKSKIIKQDGQLSYSSNQQPTTSNILYNTVTTPKGRQYALVLADGSKVWLNAASSITFPTAFTGNERKVTVTGEVFFSVVHNRKMPFKVMANEEEIEDLGTEFNVNAYSDESSVATTLLAGAVKVSRGDKILKLSPGQQSVLDDKGSLTLNRDVNTEEIVAWKDGYFHFESADLKTILRQFSRWYDIEVIYEGHITDRKFFGIVKRSNTLTKVLEMLQDNNIVYQIEGKKLIVKSS